MSQKAELFTKTNSFTHNAGVLNSSSSVLLTELMKMIAPVLLGDCISGAEAQ
jgi:hypothetical protein